MEEKRKPLASIGNRYALHHPISDTPTKQSTYLAAKQYWDKGETEKAETLAIEAMRLGSENAAPELLAEIAMKTKSKSTAMTLASYYYRERKDFDNALEWANTAIQFGSKTLAKDLIAEIAHKRALELHEEALRY